MRYHSPSWERRMAWWRTKPFAGKLLELLEFALEPCGDRRVHPGALGEKADHDMLVGALADRPAKKRGKAFVQHIDDTVVVDGLPAFAEAPAAGGAGGDFICNRLAARRTEFHGVILRRTQ